MVFSYKNWDELPSAKLKPVNFKDGHKILLSNATTLIFVCDFLLRFPISNDVHKFYLVDIDQVWTSYRQDCLLDVASRPDSKGHRNIYIYILSKSCMQYLCRIWQIRNIYKQFWQAHDIISGCMSKTDVLVIRETIVESSMGMEVLMWRRLIPSRRCLSVPTITLYPSFAGVSWF